MPKASQQMVATLARSVFQQPDAQAVREQHGRVVEQLEVSGFYRAAQFSWTQPKTSLLLALSPWSIGSRFGATIRKNVSRKNIGAALTSSEFSQPRSITQARRCPACRVARRMAIVRKYMGPEQSAVAQQACSSGEAAAEALMVADWWGR